MGKNIWKRFAALFLSLMICFNLTGFEVYAKSLQGKAATGNLTVTGGVLDKDYTYEGHVLTVQSGAKLIITGTTETDRIVVKKGVRADITLSDVHIKSSDNRPFDMKGAVVTLHLQGTNKFTSPSNRAALYCPEDSELILEGPGTLNAAIGERGGAAAIGGESIEIKNNAGYRDWTNGGICGKITINSGTVNASCPLLAEANADMGAAIGGSSGGPITINGGSVTAIGEQNTVGIGSLRSEFEGIYINGGTVVAKTIKGDPFNDMGVNTSLGPAIGVVSGYVENGVGVPIKITGGTVTAQSNFGCAGIGGGRNGYGGIITITGTANVKAIAGYGAAGIGGGYAQNGGGHGGVITIEGDAIVEATGGTNGSGIGGGAPRISGAYVQDGYSGLITIAGNAVVKANGGEYAPGIGSGGTGTANGDFRGSSKVEKICIMQNASVTAKGGIGSACDIGPGMLGGANPRPEERFNEFICTVPGVMTSVKAQNSLFVDADGNYTVTGNVTLTKDFTIPEGKNIYIPEGSTVTVAEGAVFTCPPGTVTGDGKIESSGGIINDKEEVPEITGVTITPALAAMGRGDSIQFTAAVSGTGKYDDGVVWSVEEGSSTVVSPYGLVTAGWEEASDKVIVKAASRQDPGKSATAEITITGIPGPNPDSGQEPNQDPDADQTPGTDPQPGQDESVRSLNLEKKSLSMRKGEKAVIKAQVTPALTADQRLHWSSSNEKAAAVDQNGKVTAKKYGKAVITAQIEGSNVQAGCKVSVGYAIRYKLNGGRNHKNNPASYYRQKINLKKPVRNNYMFSGWYTDKKFRHRIKSIPKSARKDYTLYAKWEKVKKPQKPLIESLKSTKAGQMKIRIKKIKGAEGYQIAYSTNSRFKPEKRVNSSSTQKTIGNLKKGKTYYVKVYAYKKDSAGRKIKGAAGSAKKVKIRG